MRDLMKTLRALHAPAGRLSRTNDSLSHVMQTLHALARTVAPSQGLPELGRLAQRLEKDASALLEDVHNVEAAAGEIYCSAASEVAQLLRLYAEYTAGWEAVQRDHAAVQTAREFARRQARARLAQQSLVVAAAEDDTVMSDELVLVLRGKVDTALAAWQEAAAGVWQEGVGEVRWALAEAEEAKRVATKQVQELKHDIAFAEHGQRQQEEKLVELEAALTKQRQEKEEEEEAAAAAAAEEAEEKEKGVGWRRAILGKKKVAKSREEREKEEEDKAAKALAAVVKAHEEVRAKRAKEEGALMTEVRTFSKVLSIVGFHSKFTSIMTFESKFTMGFIVNLRMTM